MSGLCGVGWCSCVCKEFSLGGCARGGLIICVFVMVVVCVVSLRVCACMCVR